MINIINKYLLEKFLKGSLFRFLCVGLVNTVVGYSLMLTLFNFFKFGYWPSTIVANTIGATLSYILNRKFTFRSHINVSRSLPRFVIVIICCYFISYFTSHNISGMLLNVFSPNSNQQLIGNLAMIIGMCLYTFTNYFGQKFFAFK